MLQLRTLQNKFKELYNTTPVLFRSPGMVNVMGAHTDYNDGFTLSANIDKEMVFAVAINKTDKGRVYALDLKDSHEFNVDYFEQSDKAWANYILGMVSEFRKHGKIIGGFDCVFASDIPIGSGMAASAAIKCGIGFLLNELFNLELSNLDIAGYATKVENEYIGVGSGIRDQFNNLFARTSHFMKLDCLTLNHEYIETDFSNYRFIIFDSQVKSDRRLQIFETRRKECQQGLKIIKRYFPEVKSLRDVKPDTLLKCKDDMEPELYWRCKFVVNENIRVLKSVEDLLKNRTEAFGQKLFESQMELKRDFQVSCAEIDFLIDEVTKNNNVLGARMIGAGVGGCTLNMVKDYDREEFISGIQKRFKKKFRKNLLVYKIKIVRGSGKLT